MNYHMFKYEMGYLDTYISVLSSQLVVMVLVFVESWGKRHDWYEEW